MGLHEVCILLPLYTEIGLPLSILSITFSSLYLLTHSLPLYLSCVCCCCVVSSPFPPLRSSYLLSPTVLPYRFSGRISCPLTEPCVMKTSIPSDVWEKKKSLIARLYKDEEWPLKQVIKQIRTEDFNPSETQLRSRLKKWRVTKPSRQTRKKPQDGHPETLDDDDGPEDTSPVEIKLPALPTTTQPQSIRLQQNDLQANSEWYQNPNVWYPQPPPPPRQHQQHQHQHQRSQQQQRPQQSQQQPDVIKQSSITPPMSLDNRDLRVGHNWAPATSTTSSEPQSQQSLNPPDNNNQIHNNSSVMQQFPMAHHSVGPTPISYELQQPVPTHGSNVPMTTAPIVSPSYAGSGYAVSTEMCLQHATPTSGTQWPTGTDYIEPDVGNSSLSMSAGWFSAPYEAAHAPPHPIYYQQKILNPSMAGYGQMVQPMSAQDMNQAFPQSPSMAGAYQQCAFDDSGVVKPWRRAITSHYGPEAAGTHARVDRQGRQRKPIPDRKRKDISPLNGVDIIAHQAQIQSVQSPMQPQFITSGQHPIMPHEMYSYASHEQLIQRPLGR